ncbi:MAG: glutaredoxin [Deltaproteobacteria bacterium]|jgi:glutaredoxin|nr:glutaredoxin [Deltaproteobacteria bacterium]
MAGRERVAFAAWLCQNSKVSPSTCDEEGEAMPQNENVKLYSLSTCSHCKSTKKLLDECTIQYEFTDVDLLQGKERAAILEDIKKFNPRCSFPTIIIGDKVIIGYREKEIKEALGIP